MIDRNTILNLAGISGDINEYLLSLYNIPVQMGAKEIVEIGTGVSTFALLAAANKTEGRLTTIDICGADALNRVPNGPAMTHNESRLIIIKGNSKEVYYDRKIDFLFLDSEHTYELTKEEIALWFPRVRMGGVIALHDTAHEAGQAMGVRKALDEYLSRHPFMYKAIHLLDTKIIGMSILLKETKYE